MLAESDIQLIYIPAVQNSQLILKQYLSKLGLVYQQDNSLSEGKLVGFLFDLCTIVRY